MSARDDLRGALEGMRSQIELLGMDYDATLAEALDQADKAGQTLGVLPDRPVTLETVSDMVTVAYGVGWVFGKHMGVLEALSGEVDEPALEARLRAVADDGQE